MSDAAAARSWRSALDRAARSPRVPFGDRSTTSPRPARPTTWRARLAEPARPKARRSWPARRSSGRGRLGRTWFSPPDAGLYVSMICPRPARRAAADAGRRRRGGRRRSAPRPGSRSRSSGRTTSSSMPAWGAGASSPASSPKPRPAPRGCNTSCSASASTCCRPRFRPTSAGARPRSRRSSGVRSRRACCSPSASPALADVVRALTSGDRELGARRDGCGWRPHRTDRGSSGTARPVQSAG